MNTQPELVLTSPINPEEAISAIYSFLKIKRKNWSAIWHDETTLEQRRIACRCAAVSQGCAHQKWSDLQPCEQDRIRGAFRREWAKRRVQ